MTMEKFHLVEGFRTWSEAYINAVSLENDILLLNLWGKSNIIDVCRLVSTFVPLFSFKVDDHSINIYEILQKQPASTHPNSHSSRGSR